MKNLARILSLLTLVAVTVFFAACDKGDDEDPDEAAQQVDKLVGTWGSTTTSYNGDDKSADYADFEITIAKSSNNGMTYTVTGRPAQQMSPWNSNGTFTFGTPVTTQLLRGDGVTITYSVDGNSLQMTLENYPDDPDKGYLGRTQTVAGDWVFNLSKEQ